MKLTHISARDYLVSRWSGGTTTQIAIAPSDAVYAQRDFLWRVSSADVELEESDFTVLPDYNRWISTLHGTMSLSHNGGANISLSPYQVHTFDGGADTHSWGRCTDFNLMLRKEKALGTIRALHLTAGKTQTVSLEKKATDQFSNTALLLFCGEGSATVSLGNESVSIAAFETVLLQQAANCQLMVHTMETTSFLVAEIHY